MKAGSASLSLYHMAPGHHRATAMWHDLDHKAEVIGTVPDVYLSQRWVSPREWVAARPPNELSFGGGEYVNLYWSSAPPGGLSSEFNRLGDEMTAAGRMEPVQNKDMQIVWPPLRGVALRPVLVQARPSLPISAEAAVASTGNSGLVTVIGEVRADSSLDAFDTWHESEYIPMVLETQLFTAAAKLVSDLPELRGTYVTLYYIDEESPLELYVEFTRVARAWLARNAPPGGDSTHRAVFESLSCPSIGHYDYYE